MPNRIVEFEADSLQVNALAHLISQLDWTEVQAYAKDEAQAHAAMEGLERLKRGLSSHRTVERNDA